MDKQELAHANEITRQVKKEEQDVVDAAKGAVHDSKKAVENLAKKTEHMDIKDAPNRLVPSAEKIDHKLEKLQENVQEAQHAQIHDKNIENYSKVKQVLKDTDRIIGDQREFIKEKTEDGTLFNTATDLANLAQEIVDESWFTLDSLWTNWTALLTVLAAGSAGSWKSMIQESGSLLNDLRYTEDFMKLLNDVKGLMATLADLMLKNAPVQEKANEASKEWEEKKEKIISDLNKCWATLAESPIWKRLATQGKALKEQASKVTDETKDQISDSANKILSGDNIKRLKDDLKGVLQLVVGKDGPSVEPFLDYSSAAWDDIMTSENYSKWASEASNLFEVFSKTSQTTDPEQYRKQLEELQVKTKEILDTTVKNENLRLALRESKKLIKAAKKDPATRKLIADSQKLIKDISNKKGTGVLDPQLLDEMRGLIVPVLIHHFDNAPIPDFHGVDKNALGTYDYHLRDMRLGTSGLIPSKIKVEFRYKTVANPSKLEVTSQHMYMYLYVDDVQLSLKDVKWSYNRHTVPRFSDEGTLDLCTAKKGISLTIKAEVHNYKPAEGAHSLGELLEPPKDFKMFEIVKADCTIDDFHVRVSDTNSNTFYEMLAGLWGTKVKHQIESLIEDKIHILASRFDRQIYNIVRRTMEPTLLQEAKTTLLSAGDSLKSLGDAAKDKVAETKQALQSL